jgi:hypothetical protein
MAVLALPLALLVLLYPEVAVVLGVVIREHLGVLPLLELRLPVVVLAP